MLFFLNLLLSLARSNPIFFIAITRHGSRTPESFMTWDDNSKWPEGEDGKLTGEGVRQEYLLGLYLKHLYKVKSNLLTENQSEVFFYSSHYERTYQSAQSLAYGLYKSNLVSIPDTISLPHKSISLTKYKGHLIDLGKVNPVHMNSYKVNALLIPPTYCDELIDHMEKKESTVAMKEIYLKYKDVILPISKHFKISQNSGMKKFERVYDSVVSNQFHGYLTPPEFDKKWLERAEKLYIEKRLFLRYKPDYFAKYSGSRLLQFISKTLEDRASGKGLNYNKGIVFSAHDSTLQDLLVALNIYDGLHSPYASILIFELNRDKLNELHVKIIYNNKELLLPGVKITASLHLFSNYTVERTFSDVADACANIEFLNMTPDTEQSSWPLSLLVFNVAITAVALIIIKYIIRK